MGTLLLGGVVAVYVILFGSAIARSAGGAVAASVVAVAWALVCCAAAHRLGQGSRTDVTGAPRTTRWRSWGWLLLPVALVSPTATHWAAGRTRGGSLEFGDADPRVLEIAQTLGWVAAVVVLVGCPLAWTFGRRAHAD